MRAKGEAFRTIWQKPGDPSVVQIIDQRMLPHDYVIRDLKAWQDGAHAISAMLVRGAPLIGATAAWSLYLAAVAGREAGNANREVQVAAEKLRNTRPTAINLQWAIDRVLSVAAKSNELQLVATLENEAKAICDEDVEISKGIGRYGLTLLEEISRRKAGGPVNVLTHCNAGSLATINWGTATAPIYFAHQSGISIHVWVDETRPRNQGSQLTAWELAENGVPHTVIVDNAGGHLMQHGMVDICIMGTDRTTRSGDVANKIGTYLKALAAHDNNVPFYVALPSTTIDWTISDGIRDIPIEERDPREVSEVYGLARSRTGSEHDSVRETEHDSVRETEHESVRGSGPESLRGLVQTIVSGTPVSNYAFDVTPARLVTGLITECGICEASEAGLARLFPERSVRQ